MTNKYALYDFYSDYKPTVTRQAGHIVNRCILLKTEKKAIKFSFSKTIIIIIIIS